MKEEERKEGKERKGRGGEGKKKKRTGGKGKEKGMLLSPNNP